MVSHCLTLADVALPPRWKAAVEERFFWATAVAGRSDDDQDAHLAIDDMELKWR